MGKRKIFNDPIYGMISFPYDILYDLIDHPFFQRLRRISQMGLSHYVYPGALHTRFHHALGALHLMTRAIRSLQSKGIEISDEEAEAVSIAILLHDIGHGPISHALEKLILPYHHEDISLAYMERLNVEFNDRLSLAINIFKGKYHKPFLHELVSSQLDMDRMDYLIRDSYFTGVAEGVIGYDRIIQMLNVREGHIVVEEKGIYSIEKFLMARRLMYLQVYLHKTSLATEQMLKLFIKKYKACVDQGQEPPFQTRLSNLMKRRNSTTLDKLLDEHALLDDVDILMLLKNYNLHNNEFLRFISKSLLNRNIFVVYLQSKEFTLQQREVVYFNLLNAGFPKNLANDLIIIGEESNLEYNINRNEILILKKDGTILPFSNVSDYVPLDKRKTLNYLCHPRI